MIHPLLLQGLINLSCQTRIDQETWFLRSCIRQAHDLHILSTYHRHLENFPQAVVDLPTVHSHSQYIPHGAPAGRVDISCQERTD